MARKRIVFVETPKGVIREVRHRNGKVGIKLEWAKDFTPRYNTSFANAQEFVDQECIRFMKPYTPMLSGILYKSAMLGTIIGSGEINQVAPYARYQYYGKVMVDSETGSAYAQKHGKKVLTEDDLIHNKSRHPQAGPFWFERMKSDHKKTILAGAKKIGGAR